MNTMNVDLTSLQPHIQESPADAWLLYDFRGSNSIAWDILQLDDSAHCTRRWAIVVPANGEPIKIVHAIERHTLAHVKAREITYSSHQSWEKAVLEALSLYATLACEYSPKNALPVVSKMDAGTAEWLRDNGHTLISSENISQYVNAVWTEEQMLDNANAAQMLRDAMRFGFQTITAALLSNKTITEYEVQQKILQFFADHGLQTDFPPVVATTANAANPHYFPQQDSTDTIKLGDVVLIDMWAKSNNHKSTFADITWMGYCGDEIPARFQELFGVIRDARNAALRVVQDGFASSIPVQGCQVDDAARTVIEQAGYGEYYVHRTGHSITTEVHGPGANMDNFETTDTREILPMTSFSIEPGIYIPNDVGMRTEIDVVVTAQNKVVLPAGKGQESLLILTQPDSWEL